MMKIFLIVAFLFQGCCSSYCHAVYLLSKDDNSLEFEEWRTTQESIYRQVWVEGKSQSDLTLADGVESVFMPDSLMQLLALEAIDLKFSYSLDEDFLKAIEDKISLEISREDLLSLYFTKSTMGEDLEKQYNIEKNIWNNYKSRIKTAKWAELLNEVYPPVKGNNKYPNFYNLNNEVVKRYISEQLFEKDRGNLLSAIVFEKECENNNQIALLRGGDATKSMKEVIEEAYYFRESSEDDFLPYNYKISTLSFGRGYYSGFLNDHEASVAFYSASKERALFGVSVSRKVFSDQLEVLIPPLTWYQNLGGTGEFWHPRTIVGFSENEKVTLIDGMNPHGSDVKKMKGFIRGISAQEHRCQLASYLEYASKLGESPRTESSKDNCLIS